MDNNRVDLSNYKQRNEAEKKKQFNKGKTVSPFFLKMLEKHMKQNKTNNIEIDLDGKNGGDFNIEI